jgi:hypothetical protein
MGLLVVNPQPGDILQKAVGEARLAHTATEARKERKLRERNDESERVCDERELRRWNRGQGG